MIGILHSEVINLSSSILEPAVEPSTPQIKEVGATKVANWGESNNYPQQLIDLVSKSTELGALLDWKVRTLHGKKIKAVEVDVDGNLKPINDPDIIAFLKSRTFKRYWREACIDITWFANVFAELIKAKSGDKIAYLGTQDASYCRFGKMNKGKINECYVSAQWPDAKIDDKLVTTTYPVIDPYAYTAIDDLKSNGKNSFIYPVSQASPGKNYYQLASWDGLRTSEWLNLMVQIPILKTAFIGKVLNVVYNIKVNEGLWKKWYADWDSKDAAAQQAIKVAWLNAMNKQLTGVDKAGSSLITEFAYDDQGNTVEGVKIEAITNPFKDGQWLEDSQEGSAHTRVALGVDATLVGAGPGKSIGGGSGSDKLVAVKIYIAQQAMTQEILLEPLYFIAEYNGWLAKYPNLEFEVEGIDLDFDKTTVRPIGQKAGGANATT